MPLAPRDPEAVRRAIADLLRALGLDAATEPELAATPARVADFYADAFAGLADDFEEPVTFPHPPAAGDEAIVVRGLPFHSLCVHHLAPFFGRATIAYVPGDRIVGISGAARLLQRHARRPQLQERLGRELADHLERLLAPRGLEVRLVARHLCMEMRGARTRAWVETRIARGVLADPGSPVTGPRHP